jgi:N-succinyldiaminopimelate aminotransferase
VDRHAWTLVVVADTFAGMLPGRLALLPPGSFVQLAALLDPIAPGLPPISLAVGDPLSTPPGFVSEILARHAKDFGTYPAINGTQDWRDAAAQWLVARFRLAGAAIDSERHLLPLNGTREGLFLALFAIVPEAKADTRPVVLIPNPFYQCYAAAALAVGAEPVFVPAGADTGFLPDYASLPSGVLARTAAAYICSPSNPEGACADEGYWRRLFELSERYGFTVLADECYADIYLEKEPIGALTAASRLGKSFARLLTFHSLSKRSGLPGLRSGMIAGDPELIASFRALRNYAGPQVPMPILAASAAAWRDEKHVAANRNLYRERFALAEAKLGNRPAFRLPEGGFFLWLDVGDGVGTAVTLWREAGIRVLPGAFMGRETEQGKPQSNPGFRYIRIALVNQNSTIVAALDRAGEILERNVA